MWSKRLYCNLIQRGTSVLYILSRNWIHTTSKEIKKIMKLIFNMGFHFESFIYMRVGIQKTSEEIREARTRCRIITEFYEGDKGFNQFLTELDTIKYKPSLKKL
jgi:hypothetical protein